MRIAVSGSHRVGKTTLAEALAAALPHHELVPEPYELLADEGHVFGATPAVEDFELQLERSLQCLRESGTNVIFDRCPLDILSYLVTHRDRDAFRLEDWLPDVELLVPRLELIVFVPIEAPDRVPVRRPEARLRADVDTVLHDLVVDDAYGLGVDVVTVSGTTVARVQQVLSHLRRGEG